MQRQEDMRAMIQAVLPYTGQMEAGFPPVAARPGVETITLTEAQSGFLRDLQAALSKHGIDASVAEVGQALLQALSSRPSLCRGLMAAYLVEG
jgi:hypothetical protein